MCCSNKLRRVTPEDRKLYLRYYMIYVLGTIMIALFFVISFDVASGNYKHLLLPDGHCAYVAEPYGTVQIILGMVGINKIAQLMLFIAYPYYI